MMNFSDNFFFIKWSVLFFIVTIFGYWGIDLNSEELYIAFSFFFLVILAFTAIRRAILFFFVKAVNAKYARILSNLFIIVGALKLNLEYIAKLEAALLPFVIFVKKFLNFLTVFVSSSVVTFSSYYIAKTGVLRGLVMTSFAVFSANTIRARKISALRGNVSRFFTITL